MPSCSWLPRRGEQFIEQFWLRAAIIRTLPDAILRKNHYRRIAYTTRFRLGHTGWKPTVAACTSCGPADESIAPDGAPIDRRWRGWRLTSTYPGKKPGVGVIWKDRENIILNSSILGSGEYHLTMDPSEKDALLRVPGAGLSCWNPWAWLRRQTASRRRTAPNLPTSLAERRPA